MWRASHGGVADDSMAVPRRWLYRLHPLVKLAWLLALSVAVFALTSPLHVAAVVAGVLLLWPTAGPGLRALRGRKVLLATAAGFLLLQALFFPGEALIWQVRLVGAARLGMTWEGFARGVLVAGRFVVVVAASQLFVHCTEPSALAYALMRAGVPYRFGFALITALRLAPVFEGEAQTVYEAQLVRGVRYDTRGPRRVFALVRQLTFPLLVSALRKVDALAVSMEGRQFGRYSTRTYLRQTTISRADLYACLALLAFAFGMVVAAIL